MDLTQTTCLQHMMNSEAAFFTFFLFLSSVTLPTQASTFHVSNKCSFPIWPATASNKPHPVVADGGFYLPSGKAHRFQVPGDWTGRIWARTGCDFNSSIPKSACQTGDCDGKLECNGTIGIPPVTLAEFTLQADKKKPNFYDVSLVDGYNLPISVSSKPADTKCNIRGCSQNLNAMCPIELQVLSRHGEVVACRSACLAFNLDMFCCRNEYGSPEKCKPSVYSKLFKEACPSYFSYAFDKPTPLINCGSDEYVITFCPEKWGIKHMSG